MTARFDGYSSFEIGIRKTETAVAGSQSDQAVCEFASVAGDFSRQNIAK